MAVLTLVAACSDGGGDAVAEPTFDEAATQAVAEKYETAVTTGALADLAAITAYSLFADDDVTDIRGEDLPDVCLETEADTMLTAGLDPDREVTLGTIGAEDAQVDGGDPISYNLVMAYFPVADGASLGRQVSFDGATWRVLIEPSDACNEALAS